VGRRRRPGMGGYWKWDRAHAGGQGLGAADGARGSHASQCGAGGGGGQAFLSWAWDRGVKVWVAKAAGLNRWLLTVFHWRHRTSAYPKLVGVRWSDR
jgi:hypothetical protein